MATKPGEIKTVDDAIAWFRKNQLGLNGLMQIDDSLWRCSVRMLMKRRGVEGQHLFKDGRTPIEAVQLCVADAYAYMTEPPPLPYNAPPRDLSRRTPVVDDDALAAPPPRRRPRAPVDADDII